MTNTCRIFPVISLTQRTQTASRIAVCFHWQQKEHTGAHTPRSLLCWGEQAPLDCDLVAILLDRDGELLQTADTQLRDYHGALQYLHDSQDAQDACGDQMLLCPDALPPQVARVIFAVHLYDAAARGQDWSMLADPTFTLLDRSDDRSLYCSVRTSSGAPAQGQILGELTRADNGRWCFCARSEAVPQASCKQEILRWLRQRGEMR
jgi:stress response protein SCP2